MAIRTEFIDFIVAIETINVKYPGGWEQCLEDHENLLGGRVWHDEYLFRDGAMNPSDIGYLIEKWTSMGFSCYREVGEQRHWLDVCVHERMFGGSTLPCDWLITKKDGSVAHIADPDSGLNENPSFV